MRRISYKTLIILTIIVGVAAASIAVQHFRFSVLGFTMSRGSEKTLMGLQLGLDLQGGVHVVYQATTPNPTEDQMQGVVNTIKRRVDAFGVSEPVIQRMGQDRILVQLPGVTDVAQAKNLIGQTARLEFKERDCIAAPCEVAENHVDKDTGLAGEDLARAYAGQHPTTGQAVVNFEFKSGATRTFGDLTTRLSRSCTPQALAAGTCDQIGIFLDNQLLISPIAQTPILNGTGFIEGPDFTVERTRTLAIQLESGRLPVPIQIIQERDVDATLGSAALKQSLIAGLVGGALVLFFMVAYYRLSGVVACVSLVLYTVVVLGVFKLVPVTLTLAGVAAFIISLGMAVDANVLIFERMKEEMRLGRTLLAAIQIGFSRAWPSIRDSNITTFITCGVLFWFGSQFAETQIMGFALTLFIGVATSMFTAITASRVLAHTLVLSPLREYRGLFSPEGAPLGKGGATSAAQSASSERG